MIVLAFCCRNIYIYEKVAMTEATNTSMHAFAAGHYDYKQAIKMYDREIEQVPYNYPAYNNRGLCKIHLGSDPYDSSVIKNGIEDFNTAIELARKEGVNFESAQHNLALAIEMLKF